MRFVIDREAFRALVRRQPLAIADHQIVLSPRLGWLDQAQAVIDGARSGDPPENAIALPSDPPDPPQAREFLPNRPARSSR